MSNFKAVQLASHNLGITAEIIDMEADQLDDYMAIGTSNGSIYI